MRRDGQIKRLIVFGATSAISQAFLNRVAGRCRSITLVARNEQRLGQVADHITTISTATVSQLIWDLSSVETHDQLLDKLGEPADVVLICYGELSDQLKCVADKDYAEQQFRINGISAISLARLTASAMAARQSGTLVVVGSVAGDRGRRSNYYYGAAKSALDAFLSGLRGDVFSTGVRVVTVKPGIIETPMTRHLKKGPLWSTPDRVAADIDRGVSGSAEVIYTPWFWRYVMLVIKLIPERIFKRLTF